MEKVTVRIGRPMMSYHDANEAASADVDFLKEALDISTTRARNLVMGLRSQCEGSCSSQYLHLDMTYAQLGKYSALRRMPVDHVKYWLCPKIMDLVEDDHPVYKPTNQPIEVRPTRRTRN